MSDDTALLKSEFVLDLVGLVHDDPNEALVFCFPDDLPGPQVMLRHEDWDDLGRPVVITVTIVSDDTLNDG